jgi:hypothetical protein
MTIVKAYCDGSISDAVLIDPLQSQRSGNYIARLIVLVPICNLGLITQTKSGILTPRGTPNSVFAEELAIRKAIEFCTDQKVGEFVIYSDCKDAITKVNEPRVHWASRKDMHLPNTYFDRILRRASYLRQTEGKVKKRKPPTKIHQEIFDLFQAERQEFRLSESLLWVEISKGEVPS